MIRLTFRHDDGCDDTSRWAARLRDATPSDVHVVAAFTDETTLDVYVETAADTNVNAAIDHIATTLGLDRCRASFVVPVPLEAAVLPTTPAPTPQLTAVHRGQIVGVTVSPDGRDLSVKVRHRRHETIDRVEAAETENLVQLRAWVGADPDDPRGDYATLADTFSAVTASLGQAVGNRRIVYDS